MHTRIMNRLNAILERYLPEQRLFLRSDTETRFIRLRPGTQTVALFGCSALVGWTIIATAILMMDSIGAGSVREQAEREQITYEARLNELSAERDARAEEAVAAQERFNAALDQISKMQSQLLASEDRRKELETGIGVIQATLRRTMTERDEASDESERLAATLAGEVAVEGKTANIADPDRTVEFLNDALQAAASERDEMSDLATLAQEEAREMAFQRDLILDRNDKIFTQLEEALTVSVEPLEKMFSAAGLPPDSLINSVKSGYAGQGGPLTPISFSTKGAPPSEEEDRANAILRGLDRMNLYRIAVEKAPFDMPLKTAYRQTSPFGQRWGRMHEGVDFAGAHGSPVLSTADGVVTHAGWSSGYGKLVKIKHEFGIETRYGHNSEIFVKVGQRVSRGDKIAAMGNTGRSTGTHLHYEVRVGGTAVNPIKFIKAGKNVF
ncbi:DUF5930 domain-containing protein [Roseicyclus sp. F158]|uniref:DUF5930 domain-containing protein n=1 Tax=Tropicimonas omnivorans TaxID=3075590 RepID=A0ABU3DGQ8_9RHOB|nr:DUF5930 domain-containing protein [Roseicyclus sp. F158]MDT0682896.1 DUF5930 domain-containing protein [Roseicyclus sp. F158]